MEYRSSLGVNMPSTPTKTGYKFAGWNTSQSATTGSFTASTLVTSDITVYAIWIELTEVTFINTAAQLNNVRNNLSGNYRLTATIALETYGNWQPIGTESKPFTGTFDGNGYKITGLTIDRKTEEFAGLFGFINGGTITNLALEDVDIVRSMLAGAIAGVVFYSTITNSYSTGNIFAEFHSGGIAGVTQSSTITNSYSTGEISSEFRSGGIVGLVENSIIVNSYSTGNIFASSYDAGGIAGMVRNSTITNSYSTGEISSGDSSGGIVGMIDNGGPAYITISNCAAINKNIKAGSYAGRIVGIGRMWDIINSTTSMSNNFALNTMQATSNAQFNTTDIRLHGISKTDAQLRTQSTYSNAIIGNGQGGLGWKFGNNNDYPWKMPDGGGYPILYWQ